MPLLPLEPFLYPPELFTPGTGSRPCGPWWVLHTRPRAEKVLARRLWALRHDFFLPLLRKQWQSRGRAFTAHVPLFPGYVFLCGDDSARLAAWQTKQVARVLACPDGERLQADLGRIYRLMESGAPVAPEDRLQPGMPVILTSGPLVGLEGKIVRRDRRTRFVIEVDFIQRGASVEVEGWMLQPKGTGTTAPPGLARRTG
jgi:transcriptional antiterminator RfaH